MLSYFKKKKKGSKKKLNVIIKNISVKNKQNNYIINVNDSPISKLNKPIFIEEKLNTKEQKYKKNNIKYQMTPYDEKYRYLLKTENEYDSDEFASLPKEGWIKPCYNIRCNMPTSRFIIINDFQKYYFCQDCLKNHKYFTVLENIKITNLETNYKYLNNYYDR